MFLAHALKKKIFWNQGKITPHAENAKFFSHKPSRSEVLVQRKIQSKQNLNEDFEKVGKSKITKLCDSK